ncbi:MAG: polymer-forming cytoskeletal protein [Pseudomonadota bacterium]
MWNKKKRRAGVERIDSLIGAGTEIRGDVIFSGGLHIDGKVKGNVLSDNSPDAAVIVSNQGVVEGEVRVAHVVLNGVVKGDVYSSESIELASEARVEGNVYYNLLEMAMGAAVNGQLVHGVKNSQPALSTKDEEVVQSYQETQSV